MMTSVHFSDFSWPSLYAPAIELGFTSSPFRPGGYYLTEPDDIFRFTLYWTLVFHLPFNFVAGTYAFCNFLFPPVREKDPIPINVLEGRHTHARSLSSSQGHGHARSQSESQNPPHPHHPPAAATADWPKPHRPNARRSRLTFALLVLLAFLATSLLSAVTGAAVLACVIVGVYRAGGFYVSTWVPFVWAVIQSLVALLEIWPSVVDVI